MLSLENPSIELNGMKNRQFVRGKDGLCANCQADRLGSSGSITSVASGCSQGGSCT